MIDADDWAKEDCACGHSRHQHDKGTGQCRHTRQQRVAPDNLPEPIFADGISDDPFAAPTNWPPYAEWSNITVPCCFAFYDAGLARVEAGPS